MSKLPLAKPAGRTNLVLSAFAFLGLLALLAYDEYRSWTFRVEYVEQELARDSAAVLQHIDDTIRTAETALEVIVTRMAAAEEKQQGFGLLSSHLQRLAVLSGGIHAFTVIGADGHIAATSQGEEAVFGDLSDSDCFRYHHESRNSRAHIGKPIKSRLGKGWVLPITRRYERADGSFGGVAVASVPLAYFSNFFDKFETGKLGSFLLVRGDGVILARSPVREELLGVDISTYELFSQYLAAAPSGIYEFTSLVEGERRYGAYVRSPVTGIVVQMAASRSETLAGWSREARIRWPAFAIVMGIAGLAAWRWTQQARLRGISEMNLAAREAEFRLLAESSTDMIQRLTAEGVQEYVSPASMELLGAAPEKLIGRNIVEGLDADMADKVQTALARLHFGARSETLVLRRELPEGRTVWQQVSFSRMPANASGPGGIVAITRDVTRQKQEQDHLDQLANTDSLTELANRRAFDSRLALLASGADAPVSLLMIDADCFKLFNDTYGHGAGDECLKAIAGTVRQCVAPAGGFSARFGGEEIAVLLPGAGAEQAFAMAEDVRARVEKLGLRHRMNEPWGHVTVSIGAASQPAGSGGPKAGERLFLRADRALYRAKQEGRNRTVSDEIVAAGMQPGAGPS